MPLGKMSLTISSNQASLSLYSDQDLNTPKMTIIYTGESHDYGVIINPNDHYQMIGVEADKDEPNNSCIEDLFEQMKVQNNMFAHPQIFQAISISFAAAKPFIGAQCEPTLDLDRSFYWQKKALGMDPDPRNDSKQMAMSPSYVNSHPLANIKEVTFYSSPYGEAKTCMISIQCNDAEKYHRALMAIYLILMPQTIRRSSRVIKSQFKNEIQVSCCSDNYAGSLLYMRYFLNKLLQEEQFAGLKGIYPDAIDSLQNFGLGYTQKLCRPSQPRLAYVKPVDKETISNINTQRQTL